MTRTTTTKTTTNTTPLGEALSARRRKGGGAWMPLYPELAATVTGLASSLPSPRPEAGTLVVVLSCILQHAEKHPSARCTLHASEPAEMLGIGFDTKGRCRPVARAVTALELLGVILIDGSASDRGPWTCDVNVSWVEEHLATRDPTHGHTDPTHGHNGPTGGHNGPTGGHEVASFPSSEAEFSAPTDGIIESFIETERETGASAPAPAPIEIKEGNPSQPFTVPTVSAPATVTEGHPITETTLAGRLVDACAAVCDVAVRNRRAAIADTETALAVARTRGDVTGDQLMAAYDKYLTTQLDAGAYILDPAKWLAQQTPKRLRALADPDADARAAADRLAAAYAADDARRERIATTGTSDPREDPAVTQRRTEAARAALAASGSRMAQRLAAAWTRPSAA